MKKIYVFTTLLSVTLGIMIFLGACTNFSNEDVLGCNGCLENDLITGNYNPQPYNLDLPEWMPNPIIPEDNPLTEAGVHLGRYLFYDPILSADGSLSCGSCHQQSKGFTNGTKKSTGVLNLETERSAMSLVNLAFNPNQYLWDGKASSIEGIVIATVEDHVEMNENWENVEYRLRSNSDYPSMFRRAFGIDRKGEITRDLTAKAIAQFVRTIVSFNSEFDRVVWLKERWPTDEERRGQELFYIEPFLQTDNHPGCTHCHLNPLFTDNLYKNNGIDDVPSLADFLDLGRGAVTKRLYDNGKFRVPTLRNIAATAPYMHDGRFETLEAVLDHYAGGGHNMENEDVNIQAFTLTEQEKNDMITFLHMLTDSTLLTNPAYANPFEEK